MRLRRIVRSPGAFWLAAIALACFTAITVGRLVGGAQAAADRLGRFRTVVVAGRDLPAGAVIRAADVELRTQPAAFLAAGALGEAAEAVGHTVVVPAFRGEPLLAQKLAPAGVHGVAALLPPGTRAIAVPAGVGAPPLRIGDHVDLLATFEPDGTSGDPTLPVAERAIVVDVAIETVTLAVTMAEAPRVAFALAHGVITLAVAGP